MNGSKRLVHPGAGPDPRGAIQYSDDGLDGLTDFETRKHHYTQKPIFFGRNVTIRLDKVRLDGIADMTFSGKELKLNMHGSEYALLLKCTPSNLRSCIATTAC